MPPPSLPPLHCTSERYHPSIQTPPFSRAASVALTASPSRHLLPMPVAPARSSTAPSHIHSHRIAPLCPSHLPSATRPPFMLSISPSPRLLVQWLVGRSGGQAAPSGHVSKSYGPVGRKCTGPGDAACCALAGRELIYGRRRLVLAGGAKELRRGARRPASTPPSPSYRPSSSTHPAQWPPQKPLDSRSSRPSRPRRRPTSGSTPSPS